MKMGRSLWCRRRQATNHDSIRRKGLFYFIVNHQSNGFVFLIKISVFSSYLCDVTLRSEDGKEFPCHKCVLCARMGEINFFVTSRTKILNVLSC